MSDVKQLTFRPFRRVGDKLVVTSYMGWRKIYTANYSGAEVRLLPFPEIQKGEIVYCDAKLNHWHQIRFEPLYWPVHGLIRHVQHEEAMAILGAGLPHPYSYPVQDDEVHSMFDCDGCPCFSHKTAMYVATNYPEKMHLFETLTADIVYEHFEVMRDRLKKIIWIR